MRKEQAGGGMLTADGHEYKEENTMTDIYSIDMKEVITRAAAESGIRDGEAYRAEIISVTDGICEIELETEWNRVTCYADAAGGGILGLMSEAKTIEEILWSQGSVRTAASNCATAGRAA